MNLIERYLYAVMKYLPSEIREDIGNELRSNIEDMLPENYNNEDVYQLLMDIGSPKKLANEYNTHKKYLIGPSYYDKYISTLKSVIKICIVIAIFINFIVWIIESPVNWYQIRNIIKLITSLITSGVYGVFQGAIWVTIVFIILERSGVEAGYIPFYKKKWTPHDLPELPANTKGKISRSGETFTMFVTILFTALLYFKPQLISLYFIENESLQTAPLFIGERLNIYIPIILVLSFIQLGMFVWKFIRERWNLSLLIINAVYYFAISILVIVMLSDNSLINPNFNSAIAELTNASISTVSTWIVRGKWIFAVAFIGICIFDSIIKFLRNSRR